MSAKLNIRVKNNRFFYMYRYGLDEFIVAKFLKQSKTELTKNGAKGAMSLPEEFTYRAIFLAGLPPKCFPIVASWFSKNPPEGELSDLEESISVLSKAGENFEHSKESSKKFWRTIFLNYINSEKTSIVKSFLMGEKSRKIAPPSTFLTKKTDVIVKNSEQKDLNDSNRIVDESLGGMKNDEKLHGFSYVDSKKLDLTYKNECDGRPILGEVATILENGQFFIDIKGVLIESDLIEITQSQAMHLYPEQGGAVGFPEKLSNIPVSENLLAIWSVHDQANNKKARFMIDSCINIVLDIFEIPHSSSEPDLIRSWLKNSYPPNQGIRPVFELADGVIIKPQSLLWDFRTYDFAVPFLGYYSHEAIKWNGRKIVIKPFPTHSFKYECVTTETAVKRLLKFKSEVASLPVITNKQIQELAFLVNKESTDRAFSNSYHSISNRISEIFAIKDNVDAVIDEILQLPAIQTRLAEEIADLKKEISNGMLIEKNEVVRLKQEKKALEQEIAKSSSLLSRSIKKAFNEAVVDGVKVLTDIALIKPFLATTAPSHMDDPASITGLQELLSSKNELLDFKVLMDSIKLTSLKYGLKENLISTFITAGFVRGVVGVFGENSKKLIQAVANVTSAGIYSSISLSIDKFSFNDLMNSPTKLHNIDCDTLLFGELLESWQKQDAPLIVELMGFNRMPPESIITEILDEGNFLNSNREFIWKTSSGNVKKIKLRAPIFFVLNFVYGKSTFPIPLEYASSIPLVSMELFTINPFEEGLEIPLKSSYLGGGFLNNSLGSANSLNGFVDLLKLMGFDESESICYSKLTHAIGRIDYKELLDIFSSNGDLLNFLDLNSLAPERANFIFERN